jgi:hypothetical protein
MNKTIAYVRRRGGALEVGLDGAVLLVEERHVRDKVLDDVHVREWVDARLLGSVCGNAAQAGQGIDTVDVHGAATANALTTTPPEGKGRVDLVLDADERIQHHRPGLVQVQRVRLHLGLRRWLVRIPSVDLERLGLRILAGLWLLLGVGDGGESTREDCRAEGCVRASAGLNGALRWCAWYAYLSAS